MVNLLTFLLCGMQVTRLMNSTPSLVTCAFSFLGFLDQELDLDIEVRGKQDCLGNLNESAP